MKRLILLFLISSTFLSCSKENRWDALKGAGKQDTLVNELNAFRYLKVDKNMQVYLHVDTFYRIQISGGSNLLPLIEYTIDADSVLYLNDNNRCNWSRSYKNVLRVDVTMPYLLGVEQVGVGNIISVDTLRADVFTLNVRNSGDVNLLICANTMHTNLHVSSGDINLLGRCGVSYLYNSGAGTIHAQHLATDITFAGNHDTGLIFVNAASLLEAEVDYIGDIYYAGTPDSLLVHESNKGRVLPLIQ